MNRPRPIGRLALGSLVFAALVVVVGKVLDHPDRIPFWGGLLAAFGEAALVGGLADWFAVRALFAHPLGLPFPHTALIPHNRRRIVHEIRALVETEWLPRSLLVAKVSAFDFVARITPALDLVRGPLRDLLRAALGFALRGLDPQALAKRLAGAVGQGVAPEQAAALVADVIAQARERRWLTPVVVDLVAHLERWSGSPTSRKMIRAKLEQAAESYRKAGAWKDLALSLGEIFGGVDLDRAALTLQQELQRFAREQQEADAPMHAWLDDALLDLDRRLRHDPEMAAGIQNVLADSDGLAGLAERLLIQLRDLLLARLDDPEEPWSRLFLDQAERWLRDLAENPERRAAVNAWAGGLAVRLVEEHHSLIGNLVAEQMNRLSGEQLSALIQDRVGEDLNWIRLNGTFVGGLIGVAIYLVVALARWAGCGWACGDRDDRVPLG